MFTLFGRFHRHKDLEEAIITLSKEVSDIRLQMVKIRAKSAVSERERQKSTGLDAEIAALEAQLGGKAIAYIPAQDEGEK